LNSEFAAALLASVLGLAVLTPDARASESRGKPAERTQQQAELTPDQAFLAARRAFLNRDLKAFEAAARQARGHALADYLDYWRLSLRLRTGPSVSEETDREIERTLVRQRGTVPAELLRRDWLENLATRGQWARFDSEYPQLQLAPEPGLRCFAALSSAQQGTVSAELIETLLMVPRELPDGCRRLFDQLLQSGRLGASLAERRFLRAVESGSKAAIRHAGPAVGIVSPELERHGGHGGHRDRAARCPDRNRTARARRSGQGGAGPQRKPRSPPSRGPRLSLVAGSRSRHAANAAGVDRLGSQGPARSGERRHLRLADKGCVAQPGLGAGR
jgi:hypothetical protein